MNYSYVTRVSVTRENRRTVRKRHGETAEEWLKSAPKEATCRLERDMKIQSDFPRKNGRHTITSQLLQPNSSPARELGKHRDFTTRQNLDNYASQSYCIISGKNTSLRNQAPSTFRRLNAARFDARPTHLTVRVRVRTLVCNFPFTYLFSQEGEVNFTSRDLLEVTSLFSVFFFFPRVCGASYVTVAARASKPVLERARVRAGNVYA